MPVERTLFVGPIVHPEIKALPRRLKSLNPDIFAKLLDYVLCYLDGVPVSTDEFLKLESAAVNEETLALAFSGLRHLMLAATRPPRSSLKKQVFLDDLKELKIPDEFCKVLVQALYSFSRADVSQKELKCLRMSRIRWRLEVVISTNILSRVMEPMILFEITSTSGQVYTFSIPIAKFHELRYSTAYALREMDMLRKRNILKIQE